MTSYLSNKGIKLEVNNLKKTFDKDLVLDNVSLALYENEFVTLIGPSGSGKSTVFNIIAGLLIPDEGNVYIDGQDYTGKTGRVSYMYQKDLLLPWKTIIDNASLPLVLKGENKQLARNIAGEYFKIFGLDGYQNKYPYQLSGGMRQRAALLRTYLFSQDIMLLDEPFGGLDAITKAKMQQWLLQVIDQLNASILLITHDIEEAILLSDRIYVLEEKPARIKAELYVDIAKGRTTETITSTDFVEIKKKLLTMLQ